MVNRKRKVPVGSSTSHAPSYGFLVSLIGTILLSGCSAIRCSLTLNEVVYYHLERDNFQDKAPEYFWGCEIQGEEGIYLLEENVLSDSIVSQANEAIREQGNLEIWIPDGTIDSDVVKCPHPALITPLETSSPPPSLRSQQPQLDQYLSVAVTPRRRGPDSVGTADIAVLRIHALDSSPTTMSVDLEDLLIEQENSAKRQFEACSSDAFSLSLYGVFDVFIDWELYDRNGRPKYTNTQVANEGERVFNRQSFDLKDRVDILLIQVPPGTGFWAAYATVNGKTAVFNDVWLTYLGAQMHEMAHNLGLRHAWENDREYQDKTGYMGHAERLVGTPLKCFNAYSYWYLKWQEDRQLDLSKQTEKGDSFLIKVAAFVDYDRTEMDEYTVVRVTSDLYLQYNAQRLHNEGTDEYGNELLIVRDMDTYTHLEGHLQVDEVFVDDENDVEIRVCDRDWSSSGDVEFLYVSVGASNMCDESYVPILPLLSNDEDDDDDENEDLDDASSPTAPLPPSPSPSIEASAPPVVSRGDDSGTTVTTGIASEDSTTASTNPTSWVAEYSRMMMYVGGALLVLSCCGCYCYCRRCRHRSKDDNDAVGEITNSKDKDDDNASTMTEDWMVEEGLPNCSAVGGMMCSHNNNSRAPLSPSTIRVKRIEYVAEERRARRPAIAAATQTRKTSGATNPTKKNPSDDDALEENHPSPSSYSSYYLPLVSSSSFSSKWWSNLFSTSGGTCVVMDCLYPSSDNHSNSITTGGGDDDPNNRSASCGKNQEIGGETTSSSWTNLCSR